MAVRLVGAQTSIGNALKSAVQKLKLQVEDVGVAQVSKGRYVSAPQPLKDQLQLVQKLQLHSKVVSANNRIKSSAYYGVPVTSVTNLANYHTSAAAKLALYETYSKSGFGEAGKRYQDIRKELLALFSQTALTALRIAANTSNGSVTVVTKSQGKFNPLYDAILWEAVEAAVKSDKSFEKVSFSNVRSSQAINRVITQPEKLSVLVGTPEEDSQRLADIVVGLGGGKGLVPIDYLGQEGTIFTASNNQSNNPVASFLALGRYLAAEGKTEEAKKLVAAVEAQIDALALKEKDLSSSIKGEEIASSIIAKLQ